VGGNRAARPRAQVRSLQRRYLALITLDGVIGALAVGPSISATGPAVVLSYLIAGMMIYAVMAIIGELTTTFPNIQAFTDLVRASAGSGVRFVVKWLYGYLWFIIMSIEAPAGAALLQG
jgi:GABA permease